MTFNLKSFILFLCLFVAEVLIATLVTQPLIRYWFGDVLVVIMIYYFLKSFVNTQPIYLAIGVLLFAFAIEFMQLTNLLDLLGLRQHRMANLLLGNTFSFSDLLAYVLGIAFILFIENIKATL